MKNQLHNWLICFFLCISSYAFSSHIVGGTLTYVRNPNATYTITLKLYRDCSPNPNKAPFDQSVTITVLGYNGALFSPTRDITMSLSAINPVPPILPPCAIAPNPIPCVQEGIYTKIVTLPPNPGGYHLYWQRAARNVAINNCKVDPTNCLCLTFPCGYVCVGSSFDADIPGETVIWGEDFNLPNNSTVDNGITAWSIAAVGTFPPPASAWVNTMSNSNKVFEITGASNAQKTWTSQTIPISSCPSVDLRVDLSQTGNFLPFDSLFVYYRLNGGPLTLFPTNGIKSGNFSSAVASKTGISGSNVQIIIRAHFASVNNFGSKKFQFDNVLVSCSDFVPNSNPVFNLFPPIFVCAGQPFTFDHSATDANGDSLVYSLYTPYNGENGPSYTLTLPPATLDPTFSGNTAIFTPIVWLPGYSVANPLGGPPLNLNPSTGLLSGTPPMIGKFVVGVKVKEYRNGVYISQTLRDFQFNVVNCPSPPLPVIGTNITVNQGCVGQISANGYIDSTVIWNSVYPGTFGAYNNYLSCSSGCVSPTATGQAGLPPYIDYQICGMSASCNPIYICDTVRVTFHTTLLANIIPQNPSICIGQSSISITANGSGGTPPYTYLWNNINPAQSILVGTGTYTVKISDASNCPPTYATVTVTSYSVAVAANAGPDKTACKEIPITTINGSVAGANGGIWSGGGGVFSPNNTTLLGATYSPTVAELAAGFADLTLTTTGSGTCPAVSDIVRINYINFTGIVSFTKTPVSCFGGTDGSATVSITGGTPNYSYSWNTVPQQSTATALNLSLGTYSVTVTNGIGCTSTNPVTIIQPSPIALASSITDVSCSGGSNGSISITPSGGTGPYTYLWQPGNQTTSSINGKAAGTYTITVTDSKSCQKTSPYQITEPTAIAILLTGTPVNCFGGTTGTASSTVTGGTSPYSYNWNSGATSPIASGLPAGTFTLTVTDNKGCLKSNSVTITQPTALIASTSITNETCNYLDNGSATAGSSGGTPGYTYLWSNGITSSQITNLTSQIYTLTVTDSVGCTATAFATITETALLTINFISQVNVSCFAGNDGMVTASPVGGIPNYTYLWSNGATTSQISNLTSQIYSVAVTDSKGCVTTDSVTITQPSAPLSVSVSSSPATCYGGNNGSVSATAADGTGPYTYTWTPGNLTGANIPNLTAGTYTVTAADSKGCLCTNSDTITQPTQIVLTTTGVNSDCGQPNGQTSVVVTGGSSPYTYLWSPTGGTNATAPGLISGAYIVVVTDSIGCVATQFGNVDENSAPTASILSVINVSCNGGSDGSAKVATSGGIGPFTYSWMPSGGTDSIATGLAAGSYTVTVTGTNGCKALATINPGITQPLPILITVTKSTVSCFGGNDGTASAIASSGTPGYTYKWLPSGTIGSSITNLSADTYTIEVTDNNNCVQTMPVIIMEPSQVSSTISSTTNVKCIGESNGTASAIISGGTPVYNYNWMPWGGNGPIGTGLSAGTYTVTTSDSKGCIDTSSVTITEPSLVLSATNTVSSGTCFGASNAAVGIHPAGGTPVYSFQWNPSVSLNDTASGLAPGNYTITVSDYNSCKVNLSVSISEPSEISGSLITVNPACGLTNGSISSQVSGGSFPYTYLWSVGAATTSALTGLGAGVYNLLVTDASGCTKSLSANLIIAPGPTITFPSVNNVSCNGGNDGSATITITQGLAPFIINWSPSGGNSLAASGFSIGTYTVTVSDALGCQLSDSVIIAEPTPVDVSVSSITDVLCNGGNTGAISVAPTGGTGPLYTYLWTPGGSTFYTADNLTAGTFTVNVTDQNNCVKAISAAITEPSLLSSSVDTIVHATCFNGFGSATLSASGGVLPYSYSWSAPAVGQTGSEAYNLIAGSYTVTVTDTNGCFADINVLIKQPLQVITLTGENDTLCLGQSGSVSASAVGGNGNYYYAWQPSGAITSGTLPITPLSNTTYTVVAFDQIGCAGTPDTVTAILYNLTGANIQVMGTSPICPGQSSFVYVQTSGITEPLTYQWNNNLGTQPEGYLVTPTQPTTYIVTATNMCGLSVSDSVEVLFIPPPTLVLTSDTNSLCIPGSMPFFDYSVAGNVQDPITMWDWNFGDGTSSAEEDPDHTYIQAGTFLVTLTVSTSGGCTSNNLSTPLTITAHPYPIAAFSVSSTTLDLPYDPLILNNQSTGANSYLWNFGDGGTSTLTNPQYVYTSLGAFQVQLIAMNQFGCYDTAYSGAEITTNADVIFPNVFTPNPNGSQGGNYDINNYNNDIFFPYSSGVIEFKIEIFNRWGEQIFESLDIKQGWDGYYRGVICQQDVYVWKAYIKLNNGKEFNKNGNVTILRY